MSDQSRCSATNDLRPSGTLIFDGENDDRTAADRASAARCAVEMLKHRYEELRTENAKLRTECDSLREQNAYLAPRWRAGQRIFNTVRALDKEFAESVRATDVDPFYDDSLCEVFLRAWLSHVAMKLNEQAAKMIERDGMPRVLAACSKCGAS